MSDMSVNFNGVFGEYRFTSAPRHINTGVSVTSNLPFHMFICGRIQDSGFGCGTQLAYCNANEADFKGEFFI